MLELSNLVLGLPSLSQLPNELLLEGSPNNKLASWPVSPVFSVMPGGRLVLRSVSIQAPCTQLASLAEQLCTKWGFTRSVQVGT